ncbi:SOCS box domain-containing protein [Trichonephila clavipes]|nr:SOCS box domain-containing protein [Trichonephila clavipes]
MEQSAKTSFIRTCIEEIVVEFLENHNYILKTKKYPLYPSDLSYEYVTLISDHYPVASSIFRWFRSAMGHCNSQNGGPIINEMVEVFREYKDELSIPLREYVLTDGILEVCYRVQIDDSQLIKQVLNLLYESWSSFGSLHFSAILKPNHHHEVQGSNQYPDYLSFFLEHARRLKLEYDGVRFIDVSVYSSIRKSPVFIAADIWCWKPLLRYLQYGASEIELPKRAQWSSGCISRFHITDPSSIPGLGKVDSAFHPYCSGSINEYQACLGT